MKRIETVSLDRFSFGGEAVGKNADGKVCFVRGGVPGEVVEVSLLCDKKNFCRGKLEKVITSSPQRIAPECPHFGVCPGCSYLQVPYEVELAAKAAQFNDFLNRGRAEKVEPLPPFGAPERFNWRSRIRLHSDGGGVFGYRMEDNVSLLPLRECRLASELVNKKLSILQLPKEFRGTFEVTGIPGGAASASFEPGESDAFSAKLAEFGDFSYPAGGFFQTNAEVAAELCRRVRNIVMEFDTQILLELYCGVGVFSLVCAAAQTKLHCIGVESDRKAVKCAIANAKMRHLADRCTFFAGDAATAPERFGDLCRNKRTVTLVDPPRSGLDKKMIASLLKMPATELIYISCGADTLRRDLDLLAGKYRVAQSGMLDMFPGTAHFESLTLLTPMGETGK